MLSTSYANDESQGVGRLLRPADHPRTIELGDKLRLMLAEGFAHADIARLTRCPTEDVRGWDGTNALALGERTISALLTRTPAELARLAEQLHALDRLKNHGLTRADIAELTGIGVDSVRAWINMTKIATGRARRRLLAQAAKSSDELATSVPAKVETRGRTSYAERRLRIEAMQSAGLYPLSRCADELRDLVENVADVNLTVSQVAKILGVGRKTLHFYLKPDNELLMPVEMVKRFVDLRGKVAGGHTRATIDRLLQPLDRRLECASIVLFGKYHLVGFDSGDPLKQSVLRALAETTGFDERTIRRCLPPRTNSQRVSRAVVEALEDAVRQLGTLV